MKMKLKRVIQLKKEGETYTLKMETNSRNYLHCVSLIEERVKEIRELLDGKIKLPKSPPKKKEKPKEINKEFNEGTAFDSISLDSEDFNLFNVEITRIGEIQSGTTGGNDWQMHSITVKDVKDKTRDLIAWGDHIELFESLKVGDMLDIDKILEIKEYQPKRGAKKIQFVLGDDTTIKGAE